MWQFVNKQLSSLHGLFLEESDDRKVLLSGEGGGGIELRTVCVAFPVHSVVNPKTLDTPVPR